MALFSLGVEINDIRKITDKKSNYLVKIEPPTDLEDSFYSYAQNFKNAAHRIASYLLETDRPSISELDSYFFSLAFLYRHSVELLLKAIAFQKISSKEDRADFAKDTFHDLEKILCEIVKLGDVKWSGNEINWMQSYFADLSKMDKESDSFRYPFHIVREKDILGETTFSLKRVFEEQTYINLCTFANKFEVAFIILKAWYENDSSEILEWKDYTPVFIETGGPYYGQSVVGYGYKRQEFHPYFRAYSETAGYLRMIMIDAYDRDNGTLAKELFMPMCYLYRNAVELSLKSIWFEEVREDFQKKCKILNKKKHSISGMWNSIQGWINTFFGEETDAIDFFSKIEKSCNELQNYDTTASRFRYPCNKEMQFHFRQIISLDVFSVAEFMEALIVALDCIDSELSHRNEYINEMEAEYRHEMESEYAGYY